MDLLALSAALSVLGAVLLFALAVHAGAAASAEFRGRLEGVLSGSASVVEGTDIDPLRKSRSVLGAFQFITSGVWLTRMERDMRLADSQLQPVDFFAIRGALAALGFAAPYLFVGGLMGVLAGIGGALVGFQAPQVWLNMRISSRANKLEEQLPEALTLIANSLKAGFGLLQSLDMAAEQMDHPVSTELELTIHETNVGSSVEEAFTALSERSSSYDLDMVVTAILVQRSTGGNLAEILETVAATMRERVRIRGEIDTLTAQQRLTGLVIGALPIGVGAMFLVVSPEYIMVLFTETMGKVMLGAALLLEAVGILIIQRILNIKV